MDNQIFKKEYGMLFIELRDLEIQKKDIAEREKEAREALRQAMEKYGIKKVETPTVDVTWVPPVEAKPKLDEKAWRAADPDGYNEVFDAYNKLSGGRRGSVRITPK